MTERSTACVFCSQPSVPWQGDSVYALFDIAPVVEGHILVCSNEHYPCAADAPPAVREELETALDWLRTFYMSTYGSFTLFEHGRTGHCLRNSPTERICHHMHVHVLPLPGDLAGRISLGQRTRWRSWAEVTEMAEDIDGYVVVETPESGRLFHPATRSLPPHYLRTLAAELVGDPALADWERIAGGPASDERVRSGKRRLRDWLLDTSARDRGAVRAEPAIGSK